MAFNGALSFQVSTRTSARPSIGSNRIVSSPIYSNLTSFDANSDIRSRFTLQRTRHRRPKSTNKLVKRPKQRSLNNVCQRSSADRAEQQLHGSNVQLEITCKSICTDSAPFLKELTDSMKKEIR